MISRLINLNQNILNIKSLSIFIVKKNFLKKRFVFVKSLIAMIKKYISHVWNDLLSKVIKSMSFNAQAFKFNFLTKCFFIKLISLSQFNITLIVSWSKAVTDILTIQCIINFLSLIFLCWIFRKNLINRYSIDESNLFFVS